MDRSAATNSLLITAAFVVIVAGIKEAEAIVVPFLLAAFIATIAATPVFWLNRLKVPIGLAIAAVVASLILMLLGVGALVAQSATDFTDQLPDYEKRLGALTSSFLDMLRSFNIELSSTLIQDAFNPATALSLAGSTLRGFGGALSNGFLILLTVIFILAEASSFPRKLQDVLDDPARTMPFFERFAANVNRYIAIKTTVSVATGLIIGTFVAILGVDFPLLWGLLAFMLNYVPTIGSIIAAVPAMLLALVQFGPATAAFVAAGYVTVNIVMGNAVEPRFMGRGLGLSTLIVFLSLVFWGWMLGPVGMLLSVPLTMTAKIALEANPGTAWIALLLGPADEVPADQVMQEAASRNASVASIEEMPRKQTPEPDA